MNAKNQHSETQQSENQQIENQRVNDKDVEGWWSLYFDGSTGKQGVGAGIWITSPSDESKFYSYKLNFDCTNNIVEYESLILGLEVLKRMKAQNISICGDS